MWLLLPVSAYALRPVPDTTVIGPGPGVGLGTHLTSGDFDGDGFDELVAVGFLTTFVYPGGPAGVGTTPSWAGGSWGDAEALDVNADGYDDLVIEGFGAGGEAWLFLGSAAGLAASPAWTYPALTDPVRFASGDLNGDGYEDLVLGDPRNLTFQGPDNLVSVFFGSAAGLAAAPARTWSGTWAFGSEVAVSDVDGDGFDDVAIGSPYDGAGTVRIYRGAAGAPAANPTWTVLGAAFASSDFGERLAGGVDLNGDGYEDLGVGYAGAMFERYVARILGGPNGPQAPAGPPQHFGQWMNLAGCPDVDGDGDDELVVGWRDAVWRGVSRGGAGIFDDGLTRPTPPRNVVVGDGSDHDAGSAVTAGDFDGDGNTDWAVGAPNSDGTAGSVGVNYDAL